MYQKKSPLLSSFFILLTTLGSCLFGMQGERHNDFEQLLQRSEYKQLSKTFGENKVLGAIENYQTMQDFPHLSSALLQQQWRAIADEVIGKQFVEEKKRYFMVNIILHEQEDTYKEGLKILYSFYHAMQNKNAEKWQTDQGAISLKLSRKQYDDAMSISDYLRATLFSRCNPLILVKRDENAEIKPETKWMIFRIGMIASYFIHLCLPKSKDEQKEKKDVQAEDTVGVINAFMHLSRISEQLQKDALKNLLETYPILKTHEVKSFVNKRMWLYDKKNWIACASGLFMILLAYCLLTDKIKPSHSFYWNTYPYYYYWHK